MAADFITNIVPSYLPTSNAVSGGVGQLADLDLDPYALNILKYPQEVSTPDAPHYVRFDINLPDSSKYLHTTDASGLGTVATPRQTTQSAAQQNADLSSGAAINMNPVNVSDAAQAGGFIEGATATVTNLDQGVPAAAGAGAGQFVKTAGGIAIAGTVANQTNIGIKPKTTRTSTSISLYMPDTVVTAYDHDWNAMSLTDAMGKLGMYSAFGASLNITGIEEGLWQDLKGLDYHATQTRAAFNNAKFPTELAGQIAQTTGAVGQDFTTFALKNQGLAVNPHLEMVFRGTQNRRYIFEFDFQPRSAKEAQNIRQILQTFRAYAAPELADSKQGNNGRYFIPPAEFDISYRFGNVENPYIARISTCALTNIAINWNQAGAFASFVDGAPVHIHVALTFMEIDIIYRELIAKKGY